MKIFGVNFHVLVHNPSKVAKTFTSFLTYYYSPNYRYIVLSNFAKKQLIRKYFISSDRIKVMPHPNFNIEYDSFDVDRSIRDNLIEWKKVRSLFLYMSGLSKNHGILEFVKLVEESIKRELPYCFLICGNPRNSKQIAISENIEARFCGTKTVKCSLGFYSVKDAKTWLSIASAVILPYQEISQSGVQALAQGQGTPVVVRDTGGLKEIIIDGFNGILVRDNSLDCWLEALDRLHRIEFKRNDIRDFSERQCGVTPTIEFFEQFCVVPKI